MTGVSMPEMYAIETPVQMH